MILAFASPEPLSGVFCVLLSKLSYLSVSAVITALADNKLDGCSDKAEGLSETVFKISLIREMEELCVVAEDNEGGGSNADLSHVVDLEALALVGGRLCAHRCFAKHVVEHTCGYAHGGLVMHVVYALKDIINSLSGLCRHEDDGSVGHISQVLSDACGKLVNGGIVFFDGIPLVDDYDGCLACVMCDAGDLFILLRNTYGCIDHNEADVCSLNRHMCAENAVFFDVIVDLGLAADTCSIDEGINVGLKVWTSDYMLTDYDWINFPYEEGGDVWDMSLSVSPNDNYKNLAESMMKWYDEVKDFEMNDSGLIIPQEDMV